MRDFNNFDQVNYLNEIHNKTNTLNIGTTAEFCNELLYKLLKILKDTTDKHILLQKM